MVCPYPPTRDGIGSYAVQQATMLRAQGHHVEVLSPLPSAAHHHLELRGWRGPLALAQYTPAFDRVIVHFHVDMFYPAPLSRRDWVSVTAGLILAFSRAQQLDLIIHEINYEWGRRASARRLAQAMLRSASRVMVHTETEQRLLCEAFRLPRSAVTLLEHGSDFIRRTNADPKRARRLLRIPQDAFVFLAIGFVQPHKGFDRAVRAFGDLGSQGCRLYVVGSVRVEEPEYVAHLATLRELASEHPGVELRIEFVTDEQFDTWLVASDVVVLPYRYIWSSSVLERARLYDRAVIASDVGGLRDQGYQRVTWVLDDDELAAAMYEAAGRANPSRVTPHAERAGFAVPPGTPRATVMDSIRERAAQRRRPLGDSVAAEPARQVAPLLRIGHVAPPTLSSRSRTHRIAKRVVNSLVRWQTEPLRMQVNALRDATLQVAEDLASKSSEPPREDQREDRG
jgi:glycosyltransferase involved in cell wall biosynthesis